MKMIILCMILLSLISFVEIMTAQKEAEKMLAKASIPPPPASTKIRSEEHTSELQSH